MLAAFVERNLVKRIIEAKYSIIVGYGTRIRIVELDGHLTQSLVAAKRHLRALSVTRTRAAADKSLIH